MCYIGYKIAWKLIIDISGSLNVFFLSQVFLIKLIKGLDSPENGSYVKNNSEVLKSQFYSCRVANEICTLGTEVSEMGLGNVFTN